MMRDLIEAQRRILEHEGQLLDDEEYYLTYACLDETYSPIIKKLDTVKKGNIVNLMSTTNYEIFLAVVYSTIGNSRVSKRLEKNIQLKHYLNNTPTEILIDQFAYIHNAGLKKIDVIEEAFKKLCFTEKVDYEEAVVISTFLLTFLKLKKCVEYHQKTRNGKNIRQKDFIAFMQENRFDALIETLNKNLTENVLNNQKGLELVKKQLEANKEILNAIGNNEIDKLDEIPEFWYQCATPNVLIYVLSFFNYKTSQKYQKAKEDNQQLKNIIERTALTKFLYSKQISPAKIAREYYLKLENNPNTISTLEFLFKLDLPLKEILYKQESFIFFLTNDLIKELNFLINSQVISKTSLKRRLPNIEEWYLKLKTNYEILKNITDFKNEFYNDEIMFLEPPAIRERLSVLKEYSLSKNNYMFLLSNYQYLSYYDLMIEKGISPIYFISICKSANPLLTIKKILICDLINESYLLPSGALAKKVTDNGKFICDDREVDQYLENENLQAFNTEISGGISTITSNRTINLLDENYRIDNLYNFDGVLISRPKFLRVCEVKSTLNLNSIILSLEYNSILSTTDLIKIQNCIKKLFSKSKKI